MNKFEELRQSASDMNIDVIDYSFASDRIKGLYCDGTIAIKKDLTETEKKCVLAEELGHHETANGNILDQSTVENRNRRCVVESSHIIGWSVSVALLMHI